ncbi:hypothetical protein C8R48DRAFT_674340 [Suillus tomentosus]|nr:hypothetical protein C8R48DRAFT_674340 [Suillus tomentosus]
MSLDIIPITVDAETVLRIEQSGQPLVVYDCKLQGVPCGIHGITGPDSAITTCTWDGCYKTLKKGSIVRHILTHLRVKHCLHVLHFFNYHPAWLAATSVIEDIVSCVISQPLRQQPILERVIDRRKRDETFRCDEFNPIHAKSPDRAITSVRNVSFKMTTWWRALFTETKIDNEEHLSDMESRMCRHMQTVKTAI